MLRAERANGARPHEIGQKYERHPQILKGVNTGDGTLYSPFRKQAGVSSLYGGISARDYFRIPRAARFF